MPEGKKIEYDEGEYAELDDLPEGTEVSFSGKAKIVGDGGRSFVNLDDENKRYAGKKMKGKRALEIVEMDLQPEDEATRELGKMTKQEDYVPASSGTDDKSGF